MPQVAPPADVVAGTPDGDPAGVPQGMEGGVRDLKSIPSLDAAALAAVRQWTFAPAVKNGRPVVTSAVAPVSFRIY